MRNAMAGPAAPETNPQPAQPVPLGEFNTSKSLRSCYPANLAKAANSVDSTVAVRSLNCHIR
jgi:hypothetical protein